MPKTPTADTVELHPDHAADLVAATLSGDIRDFLVDRIKQLPKTWPEMLAEEQREIIDSAIMAANDIVRRAVHIIAKDGRPTITAQCEQVTVKDGIKAVVSLSKSDPLRHALADSQGQSILIVVVDAENYIGQRDDLKPDAPPTEPGLPLDEPVFDSTSMGKESSSARGRGLFFFFLTSLLFS